MKGQLAAAETLFKALADGTRLRILGLLLGGEVCVCHIHDSLKIPQPKTSRHLAYLRRAGLVAGRRDGAWIHYRLADATDPVFGTMSSAVRHLLQHLEVVKRDAKRLEAITGCCRPIIAANVSTPCCQGNVTDAAMQSPRLQPTVDLPRAQRRDRRPA